LAIANGDDSAANYLTAVAYSCDSSHLLDIRDKQYGNTALHLAVAANRPCLIHSLIVAGATLNIRSRRGQTPLLLACARGLPRCIISLLKSVEDDDRARLNKYCSDVQLPVRQTAAPPVCSPETNLLGCEGNQGIFSMQFCTIFALSAAYSGVARRHGRMSPVVAFVSGFWPLLGALPPTPAGALPLDPATDPLFCPPVANS